MLVFAVPVVGLSPMFAHLIGYEIPDVPGLAWVAPLLAAEIIRGAALVVLARRFG